MKLFNVPLAENILNFTTSLMFIPVLLWYLKPRWSKAKTVCILSVGLMLVNYLASVVARAVMLKNSIVISEGVAIVYLVLVLICFNNKVWEKMIALLFARVMGVVSAFFVALETRRFNLDATNLLDSIYCSIMVAGFFIVLSRIFYLIFKKKQTNENFKRLTWSFIPSFLWMNFIFVYPAIIGGYKLHIKNEDVLSVKVFNGMGALPHIAYLLSIFSMVIIFYFISCSFNYELLRQKDIELKNRAKMDDEYKIYILKDIEKAKQIKEAIAKEIDEKIERINRNEKSNFNDEYIKEQISKLSNLKICENRVINSILVSKNMVAKELGCEIKMNVDLNDSDSFNELDLCKVIFNIFDNALNAISDLPTDDERKINLVISSDEKTFEIYCENTFDPDKEKLKSDEHGFGQKILSNIARKYNGEFKYSVVDDMYVSFVSLHQ